MKTKPPSERARERFFSRVGQAGSAWSDRNTLPLFPLLLVMDAEMVEADADYEGNRWKIEEVFQK